MAVPPFYPYPPYMPNPAAPSFACACAACSGGCPYKKAEVAPAEESEATADPAAPAEEVAVKEPGMFSFLDSVELDALPEEEAETKAADEIPEINEINKHSSKRKAALDALVKTLDLTENQKTENQTTVDTDTTDSSSVSEETSPATEKPIKTSPIEEPVSEGDKELLVKLAMQWLAKEKGSSAEPAEKNKTPVEKEEIDLEERKSQRLKKFTDADNSK